MEFHSSLPLHNILIICAQMFIYMMMICLTSVFSSVYLFTLYSNHLEPGLTPSKLIHDLLNELQQREPSAGPV